MALVKETNHRALLCCIFESTLTMALWGLSDGKPKIIKSGTPKEYLQLSTVIDAIELGLEEFHEQAEGINDLLISLPDSWLENGEIKADHKKILKEVCNKLDLKPLGFVGNAQAIVQYIFQSPSSAPNTIFIELDGSQYRFLVADHGEITQTEIVGSSDSVKDDMVEGFSRIDLKPLPTQLYLFSLDHTVEQLMEFRQSFLDVEWEKELFRQIPNLEMVPPEQIVDAACMIGGNESMKQGKSAEIIEEVDEVSNVELVATDEVASEEEEEPDDESEEVAEEGVVALDAPKAKLFSFGLPMPLRFLHKTKARAVDPDDLAIELDSAEIDQQQTAAESRSKWKLSLPALPKFSLPSFNRARSPHGPASRKKAPMVLMVAGGGLVALLLIWFGVSWSISRNKEAEITVMIETVPIEQDKTITVNPKAKETDPEKGILKANPVSKELTDDSQRSTTGKKLIGEKAKGKVIVLNKTSSLKTFEKGTTLKLDSKIYITDDEVTVASASSQETSTGATTQYGQKEVGVTAQDIGADLNLDKGSEFQVSNFGKDTYSARNDSAIAGGSSREIQAVSKEDQDALRSSLKKDLLANAEKELKSGLESGQFLVYSGESQIIKETFDGKVDDEKNTLKLEMTIKVTGYTYTSADLQPLAKQTLSGMIPDGGQLVEDSVSILSKPSEEASGAATLVLNSTLSAKYIPPTNSDDWLNEITGKTIEQTRRVLEDKSEIKSVEIKITPSFATWFSDSLPSEKNRISFVKKIAE